MGKGPARRKEHGRGRGARGSGTQAWETCDELIILHFLPGNALCPLVSLTETTQLFKEYSSPSSRWSGSQPSWQLSEQVHPCSLSGLWHFSAFHGVTAKASRDWVKWKELYFSLTVWQDKPEREATSKRVPAVTIRWLQCEWVSPSQGFLSIGEFSTHAGTRSHFAEHV